MRKLLEALSSWQGPERVGEEIARRGLLVPQRYRQEMIDYCRACRFDSDLETYWSERAKEIVLSGGRVDSLRRRRFEDALYRSAYLDQLAAAQADAAPFKVPQLHPCLRRWVEEVEFEKKNQSRILREKIDRLKEEEAARFGISAEGWTGKKRDVKPILQRFVQARYFKEKHLANRGPGLSIEGSGGKAFCKETGSGLIFHCWVDTGGLPQASGRLPLNFFISHVEDSFWPLGAGPDTIYVGSEYYARYRTPSDAVFGVFALVEIFDAFYSTFS